MIGTLEIEDMHSCVKTKPTTELQHLRCFIGRVKGTANHAMDMPIRFIRRVKGIVNDAIDMPIRFIRRVKGTANQRITALEVPTKM
jgi:hypothetical protein